MDQIGRFKINQKLGSGTQGTVFLCQDPELERNVAVKLLDNSLFGTARAEQLLRQEARAMSRIQHPNIVSIYEIGRHGNQPFMVCEYVQGEILSQLLKRRRVEYQRVLELFEAMLEGMSEAHALGIVHRDLKPTNIMINDAGVPKIMDFGIARSVTPASRYDSELTGTPRYMAPEYIEKGQVATQVDVFALGAICYEMLTGKYAFSGNSRQALLHNVVNQPLLPASQSNPQVDQAMDALLSKAVDKNPRSRYASATQLLQALQSWRQSKSELTAAAPDSGGTVEFLIRRMRHKNDFPALSQSISSLNRMVASEEKNAATLAGVILKDFALTNKILKVVNSAYYSRFAGNIGTVSRAIVVLGMQPIRSIAASLILFEHLRDKAQASDVKRQVSTALFSAVLAREVADEISAGAVEESFLCAMLHDLGRILVTYYLHEESLEVERLVSREGIEEQQAQQTVLGASYQEIGIAIAKQWNFPPSITNGMRRIGPAQVPKAVTTEAKQRTIANFTYQVTRLLSEQQTDRDERIERLVNRYVEALALDAERFQALLAVARKEFLALSRELSGYAEDNPFLMRLADPEGKSAAGRAAAAEAQAGASTAHTALSANRLPDAGPAYAMQAKDAEALLTEGIQETTSLLMGDYTLTQLSNVVLESIYRAMGFDRVVLSLLDVQSKTMQAKLGFGSDIETFVRDFRFSMRYTADVFHAVLKNGVDVYIADAGDNKIQSDIPGWYKKVSSAGSFLLFPLVINDRPIGLIYADHPDVNGVNINPRELNLLKALRNQIVLAFREKT